MNIEFTTITFESKEALNKWLIDNKDKNVTDINKKLLYVTYLEPQSKADKILKDLLKE
jgi:hypothetical protein